MGVIAALILAYLALRSQSGAPGLTMGAGAGGVSMGSVNFAQLGAGSDPRDWYQGIKPGTVTLAGQPAPSGWAPHSGAAAKSLNLAGAGIGAAEGVAASLAGFEGGTSALAASTTLGAATLGIGLAIGVASTVIGMINAHHQAAVANEGRLINATDLPTLNALVLVVQAVLSGEVTSVAQAKVYTDQIVADYYLQVKSIQRGTWHYTAKDPTYSTSSGADPEAGGWKAAYYKIAPASNRAPDPCNEACGVGHFYVERNVWIVLEVIGNILAGLHGVMVFPAIPAAGPRNPVPQISLVY